MPVKEEEKFELNRIMFYCAYKVCLTL